MCAEHRCPSVLALFFGGGEGGDFGLTVVLVYCFPFGEVFLLRIERELNCRSCDYVYVRHELRAYTHTQEKQQRGTGAVPFMLVSVASLFFWGVNLKTATQQGKTKSKKDTHTQNKKRTQETRYCPHPPNASTHTRTHQGTGSTLVLSICTPLMRFHTMRRMNPRPKVDVSMAYARATQADLHCLLSYSVWDEGVLKRRAQQR